MTTLTIVPTDTTIATSTASSLAELALAAGLESLDAATALELDTFDPMSESGPLVSICWCETEHLAA